MAHLIDFSNARANMVYRGETPWHGLGQQLEDGADIEVWAAAAGMTHTIERSKVFYFAGNGRDSGHVEDREVLWRSDTGAPLGIVSNRYQIVQPLQVLEFYRDLVNASGEYRLETAGVLDGGKKYWALARHQSHLNFGHDVIKPYLCLVTSADGSMATTAQHTSVRVVCNNTLQLSLNRDGASAVRVSHSQVFDAQKVQLQLGLHKELAEYEAQVETLINKALGIDTAIGVFVNLVAERNAAGVVTNEANTQRIVREILDSLRRAPGATLETAQGTAWGALCAVTHYVDFKARARSQNNRFKSGQFGAGADLKRKAFDLLLAA